MAQRGHMRGRAIEHVDAVAERGDPQPSLRVFAERGDVAAGESFFLARARVAERPGPRVPLRETAELGAYPEAAAAILEQRDDVVVGQRKRFGDVALVAREGFGG